MAARDHMGSTALHAAAVGGHTDIARVLLEAGANVNTTADKAGFRTGEVALHQAGKTPSHRPPSWRVRFGKAHSPQVLLRIVCRD